ncbi:MAG: NAD-dependent epimerase/dehydratase family protein, partial [Robiginitalea sp.]|uniref:NAD-dependent epimerase/dehydratase family protein n=1 Tax=Robiginitalea sp. TaxID=1902411 RepID=UPI003C79192C
MKIGITGQAGFVGSHLFNTLNLREDIEIVPFKRAYFDTPAALDSFVDSCDVIVHLAAMNRHEDPQVIYDTNLQLVNALIAALERTGAAPHIVFSSSTQEAN